MTPNTSLSSRFRITLPYGDYRRLEQLATRSGNTVMREATLLLIVGIRVAEQRWAAIDGDEAVAHRGQGILNDGKRGGV